MKEDPIKSKSTLTRRKFVQIAGGVTFLVTSGIVVPKVLGRKKSEANDFTEYENRGITLWVHLREDGQITIYNPAAEMGQGSMTALPAILAEELDADWSKVHIEHSPIEPAIYGAGWGGGRGGRMITVGSRTVRSYFDYMRQAGAQARYILLASVAKKYEVPIKALKTQAGYVIFRNKEIPYGDIAGYIDTDIEIPEIPDENLKNPADFKLIGSVVPRFDIPSKTDGSAKFAIDIRLPGMLYGVISRSPVNGASPKLFHESDIRRISGIIEVVILDHGVGIIAETLETALSAKEKMFIQWSEDNTADTFNSDEVWNVYDKVASDRSYKSEIMTDKGDVENLRTTGTRTYTFDYKNDFVHHAHMEPLNAVASVSGDGSQAEVWAGTQAPDSARNTVARILGIENDNVTFHPQYLGGGFGRRSASDYIAEAVHLSNAVRRPVKLVWTREDDIAYGMFRPASLQRMQASVTNNGEIISWWHIIVGTGDRLLGSGANTDFYSFANQRVEIRGIDHGIRTKHWRAVGHGPNKFAIESFVDEIAVDLNIDPLTFRLGLMKNHPRARRVIQAVAEMSDWNTPPAAGVGRGIAFAERSGSLGACVCEISLDEKNGKLNVHNIWASLDCGVVVQPDNVIAQMEGGILMGLSTVLSESITFKNGRVQESNFHDYQILRIADCPERMEIKLVASNEHPTGVGESGVPIIGGAVANAFAALTGKRIRHMPFTPEKVLAVLNG